MKNTKSVKQSHGHNYFSEGQLTAIHIEVERLRNADDEALDRLNADSECRRLAWFNENRTFFNFINSDLLRSAYLLLLTRFCITPEKAPVVKRTNDEIVFHSKNFCPTLEACKILGLDTRLICKRINERSTDLLVKQIDPHLTFSRNYEKLRPYAEYCEETIRLSTNEDNIQKDKAPVD